MPKKYRALRGLAYPTDPKIVKRLQAGEDIPWEERGCKEVAAGQVVDDIPSVSLAWLLDAGAIEEVGDEATG
jgi:hypothetical protein